MQLLTVWLLRPDGNLDRVGELATGDVDSQGKFDAEFAYDAGWLGSPHAFDLAPASLARTKGARFAGRGFGPPLGVFNDALPDDWGRRLLARELQEAKIRPTAPAMLARLRAGGIGALAFTLDGQEPVLHASAASAKLGDLAQAAADFERGKLPEKSRFRKLLQAGSTAGGARPKALVHDAGVEWLAKFPSIARDAGHDIVGLEAVGLELAGLAKLRVPEFRLQPPGARRVLLVRRFDVTPQGGRAHMLSLQSLLRERTDYQVSGYAGLLEAVRKYSASPQEDVDLLFRQAAFNAAFGNVDDHTKNFWFLHGEAGWRLAHAFDLVPDFQHSREHALAFGLERYCPGRAELIGLAERAGVREPQEIIDQVRAALGQFDAIARKHKLARDANLAWIGADIAQRCERMGAQREEIGMAPAPRQRRAR